MLGLAAAPVMQPEPPAPVQLGVGLRRSPGPPGPGSARPARWRSGGRSTTGRAPLTRGRAPSGCGRSRRPARDWPCTRARSCTSRSSSCARRRSSIPRRASGGRYRANASRRLNTRSSSLDWRLRRQQLLEEGRAPVGDAVHLLAPAAPASPPGGLAGPEDGQLPAERSGHRDGDARRRSPASTAFTAPALLQAGQGRVEGTEGHTAAEAERVRPSRFFSS